MLIGIFFFFSFPTGYLEQKYLVFLNLVSFAEGDSGVPISELNREYLVLRCGLRIPGFEMWFSFVASLFFVYIFNTDVYRSLCQSLLVTDLDERHIGVLHLIWSVRKETGNDFH